MTRKKRAFLFPFLLGVGLWFSPFPQALSQQAWHLFVIFLTTIVAIIVKPIPMGAIAMLAITAATATRTLTVEQAFSGFGKKEIWLIPCAFFLSRGFIKAGLGLRTAYCLIYLFGRKTVGLAYSLLFGEWCISPIIPSAVARSGGVFLPLITSLSTAFDSHPHHASAKKLGRFLIFTSFYGAMICSASFLTAIIGNITLAKLATTLDVNIDWLTWAKYAILPSIGSLILLPWIVLYFSPPEIKETPKAREIASEKLREMGPFGFQEWCMLATFVGLLCLWSLEKVTGIHALTTILMGISVLLITRVLNWKDIMNEKKAWEAFIWFSTLITLACYLKEFGFSDYFGQRVTEVISGISWPIAWFILGLCYFYSHYLFAGTVTHISALYLSFTALAINLGTPPLCSALTFGFLSNLSGGLTNYTSGPAPLFFGAGYIPLKEWWRVGFWVCSLLFAIWLAIGSLWWPFLS